MGRTKIGFLLAVHHGAQNVVDLWTQASYTANELVAFFKNSARKPKVRSLSGELAALAARLLPWLSAGTDVVTLSAVGQPGATGPPT